MFPVCRCIWVMNQIAFTLVDYQTGERAEQRIDADIQNTSERS